MHGASDTLKRRLRAETELVYSQQLGVILSVLKYGNTIIGIELQRFGPLVNFTILLSTGEGSDPCLK